MKKFMFSLLYIILLLLIFSGCNHSEKSNILDFEFADIQNIEMYNFIVPMEAKGMIIWQSEDIKKIVTAFSEIKIQRDATDEDEKSGGMVTSFRFNLKDDKEFVIAYCDGILRSPDGINYKVSGNSLETLWDDLNYTKGDVSESDLPTINR